MKCTSGKSNVIANLLSREEYYEGIFDIIIIVPPTVKFDKSSQLYFREEVEDLCEIRKKSPRGEGRFGHIRSLILLKV